LKPVNRRESVLDDHLVLTSIDFLALPTSLNAGRSGWLGYTGRIGRITLNGRSCAQPSIRSWMNQPQIEDCVANRHPEQLG